MVGIMTKRCAFCHICRSVDTRMEQIFISAADICSGSEYKYVLVRFVFFHNKRNEIAM